jgi:hypothetical protein
LVEKAGIDAGGCGRRVDSFGPPRRAMPGCGVAMERIFGRFAVGGVRNA